MYSSKSIKLNVKYFFLVCLLFDWFSCLPVPVGGGVGGWGRDVWHCSLVCIILWLFFSFFFSTLTCGHDDSAKLIFLTMSQYPIKNTVYCLVQIGLYINCTWFHFVFSQIKKLTYRVLPRVELFFSQLPDTCDRKRSLVTRADHVTPGHLVAPWGTTADNNTLQLLTSGTERANHVAC